MNFVKRFLVEKKLKSGIKTSREIGALVKALLLSTLDLLTEFWSPNLSCFLVRLAGKLIQRFY